MPRARFWVYLLLLCLFGVILAVPDQQADAQPCLPRPHTSTEVHLLGNEYAVVTVQGGPLNPLTALTFDPETIPLLDFGAQSWPLTGSTYTLTTAPESVTFTVRRPPANSVTRTGVTVTDTCGTRWHEVAFGPGIVVTPTPGAPPTATVPPPPTATPITGTITAITTNLSGYPSGVPRYEKLEIGFQVATSATNRFLPYAASYPAGVSGTGVTVNGEFSQDNFANCSGAAVAAGTATCYRQPAFWRQTFLQQNKAGRDWFYPLDEYQWTVRYAPHQLGSWRFRLTAQDSGGTSTSPTQAFTVVANPSNHGFVKVSPADPRYFEYSDGTYFPGLGINGSTSLGFDQINPSVAGPAFQTLGGNGIQVARVWVSSLGMWGSGWGRWYSHEAFPNAANEPQIPITPKTNVIFANEYSPSSLTPGSVIPPDPFSGDYYLWLNTDERVFSGGTQFRRDPCRVMGLNGPKIPVKRDTAYRVQVRYNAQDLRGPFTAGLPMGPVFKESTTPLTTQNGAPCYRSGTGTVRAASYAGPTWTDTQVGAGPWRLMTGTWTTGAVDFIEYAYLAIENTKPDPVTVVGPNVLSDYPQPSGHVFIDMVSIQEVLPAGAFGPNIVFKEPANPHYTVNQRDALAFDLWMEHARASGVYIDAVVLDKTERTMRFLAFDGTLTAVQDGNLFYGNGREAGGKTKVRFLEEAWQREFQARWGWSPNIHSQEAMNEGPTGPADGPHWIMADVFGKFMKCGVFGVNTVGSPADCTYQHPSTHPTTTSFDNVNVPFAFLDNTSGNYPDIDYAKIHQYIMPETVGATTVTGGTATKTDAQFYETRTLHTAFSALRGALTAGGYGKPVMRGELGLVFPTTAAGYNVSLTDYLTSGQDSGVWLHMLLWSGLHHGGVTDHYWGNAPYVGHILKTGTGAHDYRSSYGAYYAFVRNIPLNNGQYTDVTPTMTISNPNLQAVGQQDTANSRAHLWVSNTKHSWCSAVNSAVPGALASCPQVWDNSQMTGTVTLPGFTPSVVLPLEVCQFGRDSLLAPDPCESTSVQASAGGVVTLDLTSLLVSTTVDAGFKLGSYPP